MKNNRSEFMYELYALLAVILVIQGLYTAVVRPRAVAILAAQQAEMAKDPEYVPERTLWVIAKDYEQEVCVILSLWAGIVMGFRARSATRARRLLDRDLLHLPEGMRVLPEDAREYLRQLESLSENERQQLLPRALYSALERFGATRSVQDASAL